METWTLGFSVPEGRLQVSNYRRASRFDFAEAGQAGLDITGAGPGCNSISGGFSVEKITYDASGAVQTFAARFGSSATVAPPH